jgi:hypothetical protein
MALVAYEFGTGQFSTARFMAAKAQEPGTCQPFAMVGNWQQYHCVDPTGHEYDANAAGMMVAVQ